MSCACHVNQGGPRKAISPVVALAILAAPVLGAVLYLRSGGECDACHRAADFGNPRPATDYGEWSRVAASHLDGDSFAMSQLAGKPVILDFWATWCPQCKVQRDVLSDLAGKWGDRVNIAALAVDDEVSTVSRYLDDHPRLFRELLVSPGLLELFHVEALPTLVVIDAGGRVKTVSAGPMDAEQLRSVVEPLLK